MNIGDKVIAQYGAMHPVVEGTVTDIDAEMNLVVFKDDYDGKTFACPAEDIQDKIVLESSPYKVGIFA